MTDNPHHDRAPDLPRDPPSPRPAKPNENGPRTNGVVEDWSLADEVERLRVDAWRLAAMVWKKMSDGAITTGPGWVAGACLIAVAVVVTLSMLGTMAWPPYVTLIVILLVAVWLAPAADQSRRSRQRRWLRMKLRSTGSAGAGGPATSEATAEAGTETEAG